MSISLLLASNDVDFANAVKATFQKKYADIKVYLPGEKGAENAEQAACWHPDTTLLTTYPNLKVFYALSAGVDHLGGEILTSGLPVCRIVDPEQKQGMLEYILWGILNYQRDFEQYRTLQEKKQWRTFTQRSASDITIGLLGLGEIGAYVAEKLAQFGYSVHGWSRGPKTLPCVNCLNGEEGFNTLISKADVLINLLPLNQKTAGILSLSTFNKMPESAYLINCGRGGHVVNSDLIYAIKHGYLTGALLDVFDEEPLPTHHSLWEVEGVTITPHIGSSSSLITIVNQVAHNMSLFSDRKMLRNIIKL